MTLYTTQQRPQLYHLPATPETVHWGYFDGALRPVLTISSGDIVELETLTHRAGDAPDLLMDDGVRRVYQEVGDRGPGPHIMTGPIAVQGAEPGDTLEVRVLGLRPRLLYGSNVRFTTRSKAGDACRSCRSAINPGGSLVYAGPLQGRRPCMKHHHGLNEGVEGAG